MNYENALALRLSLETGMRVGDVVALKTENLIGNAVSFIAQKTSKSATCEISKDLARRLKTISGKEWVFVGRDGKKHRTRQAVYKDLKNVAKSFGVVENVTPHSARKTFAVDDYRKNGIKGCQKHLQHDNEITTLIYALSDKITQERLPAKTLDNDDLIEKVSQKVIEGLKKFFSECSESS
jgi:integrase